MKPATKSKFDKPKKVSAAPVRGLAQALEVLRKQNPDRILFVPPAPRTIPMRHAALGQLLAGSITPGFPCGKYIEVLGEAHSGKTTLAFAFADAIINQPEGSKHPIRLDSGEVVQIDAPRRVLYLDFEHAVDLRYLQGAARNVVLAESDSRGNVSNAKTANLWLHQPDTLEEGAEIAVQLIGSGEFGMVVIDSVPAMLPQEEKDKSMNERTMGLHAAALGKFFRRTTGLTARYNVSVVMINQWRDKIGVCFSATSKVRLADGSAMKIGTIVDKRLPVDVLSFNEKTGKVEPRRVTEWHMNGEADSFLHLKFSGGASGKRQMIVTPNHQIFTPKGQRSASELRVGDEVLTLGQRFYSDEQHELLFGSVLGDGSLRFESTKGHMRFGHSAGQAEYCKWKASVLGCKTRTAKNGCVFFESKVSDEFEQYRFWGKQKRSGKRRTLPDEAISRITAKVVAVWFMDDGTHSGRFAKWGEGYYSISATTLPGTILRKVADQIESLGLGKPRAIPGRGLCWTGGNESRKFRMGIARYIHPSMRYKIKAVNSPGFDWSISNLPGPMNVLRVDKLVYRKSVRMDIRRVGDKRKYDIGVEGNHNYFVDGVLVHNCFGDPRRSPGGKAMNYYDSIKLDVSGPKGSPWFPEGGKIANIKAMKNKVTGKLGVCSYHVGAGWGISPEVELTIGLEAAGIIKTPGPGRPVTFFPGKPGMRTYKTRDEWLRFLRSGSQSQWDKLATLARSAGPIDKPSRSAGAFMAEGDDE